METMPVLRKHAQSQRIPSLEWHHQRDELFGAPAHINKTKVGEFICGESKQWWVWFGGPIVLCDPAADKQSISVYMLQEKDQSRISRAGPLLPLCWIMWMPVCRIVML